MCRVESCKRAHKRAHERAVQDGGGRGMDAGKPRTDRREQETHGESARAGHGIKSLCWRRPRRQFASHSQQVREIAAVGDREAAALVSSLPRERDASLVGPRGRRAGILPSGR